VAVRHGGTRFIGRVVAKAVSIIVAVVLVATVSGQGVECPAIVVDHGAV